MPSASQTFAAALLANYASCADAWIHGVAQEVRTSQHLPPRAHVAVRTSRREAGLCFPLPHPNALLMMQCTLLVGLALRMQRA